MEPAATGLTAILGSITSVFSAAMGWAATVGATIIDTPLLLLFVVIPLVGLGVGMFKRLISC